MPSFFRKLTKRSVSIFLAIIFVMAVFLFFQNEVLATTDTYTSSGTWTAPAGITSITVEAWGGGGAGGGQNQNSDGGGGGGGGAYSKKNTVTVVPGNNYTVTVGAGGTGVASSCGNTGGDSSFINTATILAKGGSGGCQSTGTPPAGGLGGASGSGVGDLKYSGGQGEKGVDSNTGIGGYGGSSAGTASNGYSGPQTYVTNTYPTASTPSGGGHGGDGGGVDVNGSAPASGNGGGGGGSGEGTTRVGGAGSGGKVLITYTTSATLSASPSSCTISSGAGTCTVPFTWDIINASAPNLYNSTTLNTYSTSASGAGVSYPIANGTNAVQARNSTTVLASASATGSCVGGTTWNGSTCAPNNTAPTLSISQPDGVSDTVTVGSSYNITYSLSDAEQVVTSAFYYDTDAVGLNGTAITGACAVAPEGTNATCSWNTTGMTPGTYYVYGLTSDGIAPQVSAYSTGVIIINAVPAVPTVTSPTATGITTTGATLGANVTSLGIPAVISARGTCFGTSPSPTTNCTAEGGTTTGVFTHVRTGMSPNTFYYYRGYATNSTGTGDSVDGTFTTSNITGTISASPSTCTISSGASTCTVPFTWSITNATSPNLYNATATSTYSTSASGTGVSYPIANGANTVQVRDSAIVLNSTTATGSCISGTTWNGTICSAITYTIYASSGANGIVSPTGTTTVAQGGSQIYSVTPNSLYEVATLLIDGSSVTASTTYAFTNVTTNHTISATFSLLPVTHTITSSAGSNGAITPHGAIVVADSSSQAFNINPDYGFYTAMLLVDSGGVSTSSPYTFTNVTADHTITATFAQIPTPPGSFTIIANQNPNGTVSPSGSTTVTASSSQMYTITPDVGYDVGSLIIDSSTISSTSTTYTFTNVGTNHTIEATFTALPGAEPVVVARRLASIIFSGKAFPGGKISIVQKNIAGETETAQQGTTDDNGFFNFRFGDISSGAYSFGLLIKDPEGRTSQTKFFLMEASRGDEIYKNIVAPPTIDILNGQVSRGGNVKIFGYASPGYTIRIYLDDILSKEALAGRGGVYSFDLPTGALPFGQHKVRAKQINLDGGIESDFSTSKTFIVSKLAVVKADFSGDGKIDIKDWSIFLSRFTSKDKDVKKSIDLSGDGKVDISDFSIFIKTLRKK